MRKRALRIQLAGMTVSRSESVHPKVTHMSLDTCLIASVRASRMNMLSSSNIALDGIDSLSGFVGQRLASWLVTSGIVD